MAALFALLAALLPIAFMAGLVALLVWWQNKRRQERQAIWAQVAHAHGLQYRHDQIVGVRHGQPVRVAIVVRGSGKNRHSYTVVSSDFTTPLDVGLSVRTHGFFEDLFQSGRDILVGDPPFDQRFLVQGDEDHRVQALLGPSLRRLMLQGLGSSRSFALTDRGFVVECSGESSYAPWLSWAIELATQVTAEIHQARDRVPVASPLASFATAWATFARARGLRGMATPLCIWGKLDGFDVTAYAARTGRLRYALHVTLRFPSPLGAGLLVRPERSLDGLSKLFGAQDHRLGDPRFDEAFVVKAASGELARSILDPPVRAALLELHGSVGAITLADDSLGVQLSHLPADPSLVPRLVHHLGGIGESIMKKASAAAQLGPYR